jgi:hypothetical protein
MFLEKYRFLQNQNRIGFRANIQTTKTAQKKEAVL